MSDYSDLVFSWRSLPCPYDTGLPECVRHRCNICHHSSGYDNDTGRFVGTYNRDRAPVWCHVIKAVPPDGPCPEFLLMRCGNCLKYHPEEKKCEVTGGRPLSTGKCDDYTTPKLGTQGEHAWDICPFCGKVVYTGEGGRDQGHYLREHPSTGMVGGAPVVNEFVCAMCANLDESTLDGIWACSELKGKDPRADMVREGWDRPFKCCCYKIAQAPQEKPAKKKPVAKDLLIKVYFEKIDRHHYYQTVAAYSDRSSLTEFITKPPEVGQTIVFRDYHPGPAKDITAKVLEVQQKGPRSDIKVLLECPTLDNVVVQESTPEGGIVVKVPEKERVVNRGKPCQPRNLNDTSEIEKRCTFGYKLPKLPPGQKTLWDYPQEA